MVDNYECLYLDTVAEDLAPFLQVTPSTVTAFGAP
jgi:hypothetical protein